MPVYKDPKRNTWYVSVTTTVNGERINHKKRGFSTKSDAKRYEHEYLLNSVQNTSKNPKIGDIAKAYDVYLENTTVYSNVYGARKQLKSGYYKYFKNQNMRINAITRIMADNFLQFVKDELPYKSTYKRNLVNRIRSMFKWAYESDITTSTVYKFFNYRSERKTKEKETIDTDQFNQILSQIKNDSDKTFFMVLFYTGMRFGEALGLTWEHINDDFISIQQQSAQHNGIITELKTQSSYRDVFIPKILKDALNRLKISESSKYGFTDDWFVFGGIKPYSQGKYRYVFTNACKECGIENITPHSLRHSHASILIMNGFDIPYVSKRLGHATIQMTLDTYTHVINKYEKLNNNKLDETFKNL